MRAALLFGLLAVLGGAWAATAPTLPADYFTREVKPLNVTPATDPDNAYSDVIGPDGGELTTLDAAGNTYTLTVPKGALGFPERLTMTPLTALKGMPFRGGLNAGVQLEPEGTFFVRPVQLEVEFADKPNLKTLTPFNYTGAGQDFTTTMLMRDPGHYVFLLNHFSGAGFGTANEAERTAELVRQPLDDAERINQSVRQALKDLGDDQRRAEELGQTPDPATLAAAQAAISRALAEYEKQVIKPLEEASRGSCSVGTLYIQKVLGLERQRQLLAVSTGKDLTAISKSLGGPILLRCLEEEKQVCFKTGDLMRMTTWVLGAERQAQLYAATLGDEFYEKFAQDYNACAHFEVQVNSTLTQQGAVSLADALGAGSMIQGTGKTDYRATITSILPIQTKMGAGLNSVLASLPPNGEQPLPYAGYSLSETTTSQVALAQTKQGTLGVTGNCTVSGTGTAPGLLSAILFPAFRPADINAPDPNLDGLSPAQKRDVLRILQNTPKVGLLAPPRTLDWEKTELYIGVGQPTERAQSTCNEAHTPTAQTDTTWLDAWSKNLKAIGDPAPVLTRSATRPGWRLTRWQKTTTFPLRLVQDVPHHEQIGGSTYDETWHLDLTVVHTPKE